MIATLAGVAFAPLSPIRSGNRYERPHHRKWRSPKISSPIIRHLSPISCCGSSLPSYFQDARNFDHKKEGSETVKLEEQLRDRILILRSFLPGGSWWSLDRIVSEANKKKDGAAGKDVSVIFALQRMWKLVANDRWTIYGGFTSLLVAAVYTIEIRI